MHKTDVLLIGGDDRQKHLARLLSETYPVSTLRVPGFPDSAEKRGYEIVILPCPSFRAAGEGPETLRAFTDGARLIFGGMLGEHGAALKGRGGAVIDLLEDETVVLENAALTAEAAIALTLTHTGRALCGRRCLVVGWGRIAKRLTALLRGFGACVTVAARRLDARTEAALYGLQTTLPSEVKPEYELIFNTVPALCLRETTLWGFSPDCVWVELASAPGGLPEAKLPLNRLNANALPGRLLPQSAAEVLYRGIIRYLR